MFGQNFKTVVFFGNGDPLCDYIQKAFESFSSLKVFRSNNVDELDQILKQSYKTAVLVNDLMVVDKLKAMDPATLKRASVRFYFLDHQKRLTRDQIDQLSYKKFSSLISEDGPELRRKLELYLMGKSQYFSTQKSDPDAPGPSESDFEASPSGPKPMFFTHFKIEEGAWKMVASTHEQELDIETILNRSWTSYYREVMNRAGSISETEQDPNFSDKYHAILYPHAKSQALSLIHIHKSEKNFTELMQKAFEFLSGI